MLPFSPELAVIAVPMAVYLYALGLCHGGRHPRVVSGTSDLAWLLLSLSGLVAFGPVGQLVVRTIFGPDATTLAWSIWLAGLALAAWLVARTGRRRLVLYHVPRDATRGAVGEALAASGATFRPTLQGFEDAERGVAIHIREYNLTRTALVDGQGPGASATLARLQGPLREHFQRVEPPVSALSTAFFLLSGAVMLVPVVGFLARDPAGRKLARAVGGWFGW